MLLAKYVVGRNVRLAEVCCWQKCVVCKSVRLAEIFVVGKVCGWQKCEVGKKVQFAKVGHILFLEV